MQAVILAGGNGIRMGQISTQKCLLPIDGIPVLGHIIQAFHEAFGDIEFIIGVSYKADDVMEYARKVLPSGSTITFIPHIASTEGWGIYRDMQKHITGSFIATAGDIITHASCYVETFSLLRENIEGVITLATDVSPVDTHGIGTIVNGMVDSLIWSNPPPVITNGELRDMTIWVSNPKVFSLIERYRHPGKSIGYVFVDCVKNNHLIAGNKYEREWIHIGYPQDLLKHFSTPSLL